MKKYLKLIKSEESYNTWKDSDEAGYPHVAMYETNHPEATSSEGIIYEKSTEKPKPTITFTIDGIEYQAEDNMTWGEWVESKYNTIGITKQYQYMDSSGEYHFVYTNNKEIMTSGRHYVHESSVISADNYRTTGIPLACPSINPV